MAAGDSLRIRSYNVRFGDAFLVSVPDRAANGKRLTRHLLIDVGNVLGGEGGDDTVFRPVLEDVKAELDGRPLDLYVMTHEHLDHVQGLLHGSTRLGIDFEITSVWLTASAEGDAYYRRFPEAKRKLDMAQRFFAAIERRVAALPAGERQRFSAMLANNDPRSTARCVEHLRSVALETHYLHRGVATRGKHPFRDVKFEIWAPEEDTAAYYGTFRPMTLGTMERETPPRARRTIRPESPPRAASPPPGVDVGAFTDLVAARDEGSFENLFAIDKAKNNTSVVFTLEWKGWRFLFAADAEIRSWRTMAKHGVLKPVDFLKISHHGSHNGTPSAEILDTILPLPPPHDQRHAVVSTCEGAYGGVPHGASLDEIRKRVRSVHSTEGLPPGAAFDLHFYE
jgi:beta-lactamase superfamily II metal-dependent hydrolase